MRTTAWIQGTIAIAETVKGISAGQTLRFSILFAGPAGGQDQPLLVHANRLSGVTHLLLQEIVQGSTGEFRVNNQIDQYSEPVACRHR